MSLQFTTETDEFSDVTITDTPHQGKELHKTLFDMDALFNSEKAYQSSLVKPFKQSIEELSQNVGAIDALAMVFDANEIDALDGRFPATIIDSLSDKDVLWTNLLPMLSEIGTGQDSLGLRSPFDDIYGGPLAVFDLVDIQPTVTIELPTAFVGEKESMPARETRARWISVVQLAAEGCDVTVVGNAGDLLTFVRDHYDEFSSTVLKSTIAHLVEEVGGEADVEETEAALDEIPVGARAWDVLRVIDDAGGEITRHDLYQDVRLGSSDNSIRGWLRELRNVNCVLSVGPKGSKREIILPVGEDVLSTLKARNGRKTELSQFSSGAESAPENRLADAVCSDAITEEGEGQSPHQEAATAGRQPNWKGQVGVDYLPSWARHHAITASAPENGGVSFIEQPINRRKTRDGDEDGRIPWFSYDPSRETAISSFEWHGPLSGMVCDVRALLSDHAFQKVLTADALGGAGNAEFGALLNGNTWALRQLRQLGYLKSGMSAQDYLDALEIARDNLLELTAEINREKTQSDLRQSIMQLAHGLLTIAEDLYDLLDIEVVHEVTFPEYGRDYHGRSARVNSILTFLSYRMIQTSHYGEYNAFRVLCEPRKDKREAIGNGPTIDKADPKGTATAKYVLVGKGISKLKPVVDDRLESISEDDPILPLQTDEDGYQSFTVEYQTIATGRERVQNAAKRMLSERGFVPTTEALRVLSAFCKTPYDVTTALNRLEAEGPVETRRVRLDEVKYVLSTLPSARIFPDLNPTKRKTLKTLLQADEALTQSEIADRSGFSTRSFRNHREELQAFDLITVTDDNRYRVTLSYRGEDLRAPESVTDEHTTPRDVLYEAAMELKPDRVSDPNDPIGAAFYGEWEGDSLADAWPEMDQWIPIITALCGAVRNRPTKVRFGEPPTQAGLSRPQSAAGAD